MEMRNSIAASSVRDALIAACIFLFLRLLVLLFSGSIYLDNVEELFTGNLAADTLSGGRILALGEYKTGANDGGSLIMSILAIPVFYLGGSSFFALKLVPLMFGALAVALLYFTLAAYCGRRYAAIACLLFSLPCADYIYGQLWAQMRHQYLFPFTLALFLAFRMQQACASRKKDTWITIGGFIAGFSIYCIVSAMLAALLFLPLCWHAWRRDTLRAKTGHWLYASLGFILGVLPLATHWGYFLRYLPSPGGGAQSASLAYHRFSLCIGSAGLALYRPWGGMAGGLAWIGYLSAFASYLYCSTRLFTRRNAPCPYLNVFIVIYPLLYLLLICLSPISDGLKIPYDWWNVRWLIPLLGIAVLSQAFLIGDLLDSGRNYCRAAGYSLLGALLLFGLVSLLSVLTPVIPGYGFEKPGDFMQEMGARVTESHIDNPTLFADALGRIDRKPSGHERTDMARGAAWLACLYRVTDDEMRVVDQRKFRGYMRMVEARVPPGLQQLFKEELGSFALWHSGYNLRRTIAQMRVGLSEQDAELAYAGIARMLPAWSKDPALLRSMLEEIPARDRNRLAYAMGSYFACEPRNEVRDSIMKIADGFGSREAFLTGCMNPYGTRLFVHPIVCH